MFLGYDPVDQSEASGKGSETGAHIIEQETVTNDPEILALTNEPSFQTQVQLGLPSPEFKCGPNLYPNVHVTHTPNPVMDVGQLPLGPPQVINASNPTSGSPASSEMAALAAAEEENPQSHEQAQKPETQPPPLSPKPDTSSDTRKTDIPTTPNKAEFPSPTVPLIHEPGCVLPLPSPNPRPAPDTLSYLESASLMSGTLESLSGLGEDGSSLGSDSEINGLAIRRTDKYGFLGGSQYSDSW